MTYESYSLSVDAKGRINVPTKCREELIKLCDGKLIATQNPREISLKMYTVDRWEAIVKNLVSARGQAQEEGRLTEYEGMMRQVVGSNKPCEIDAAGRMLIPIDLRRYAEIEKAVKFFWSEPYYELWSEKNWAKHCERFRSEARSDREFKTYLDGFDF